MNADLEIAIVALYNALESGRITLEDYYKRYAAVSERYGSPAHLIVGSEVVSVTWQKWLEETLDSLIVL